MIERYTLPEMRSIWSEEAKFHRWLDVELAVIAAREKILPDNLPIGTSLKLKQQAKIDVKRILEIEHTSNHDVIAFVTQVAETCDGDGRQIHYGLTSSDVVDTALAIALRDGCAILQTKLSTLIETTTKLAILYKDTLMMGRTHGMHAEPTTFGIKVAGWVDELKRNLIRLNRAKHEVSVGKLSGAVGTYSLLPPEIENEVMKLLELGVASHSTQIVPRDRHAELLSVFALLGGALERIATEIRHGQRSEIDELSEPFGKGQRGSSAMPHKKNPILCERICGGARLLRSYALVGFENQALWMERDISHSSAERVVLTDAFLLLDYLLHISNRILSGLVVNEKQMKQTVTHAYDLHLSQRLLSALIDGGMGRNEAYELVQTASFEAKQQKLSLLKIVEKRNFWNLSADVVHHLKKVKPNTYTRTIFKKVGLK